MSGPVKVLLVVSALTAIALIVVLGAVCGKGKCGMKSPAAPVYTAPTPYVSGMVLDVTTLLPVANVPVSSSLGTVFTDYAGAFSGLYVARPSNGSTATFTVNVCSTGAPCNVSYPSTTASVPLLPQVVGYSKSVYLPRLTVVTFSPSLGVPETNITDNAAISVAPPGAPGSDSLSLRYAVVPAHAGPGQLQSDIPGSVSNSTMLQSLFMFYMEVVDQNGACR